MTEHAFFPRLRPSKSYRASRLAEIARLRRMTVEERVKAALGLASHFAAMQPVPRKD
jgi:tRNA A-37 threonylcarbamoyl transferase component Bud32